MAFETVEKVREYLKDHLTSNADTISSDEFKAFARAITMYLAVQEKRFNMAIQMVIQSMTDKDDEEVAPAASAGATAPTATAGTASSAEFEEGEEMTEEELRAAAANPDVKSVPFPDGVKWKADAPAAAPAQIQEAAPAAPIPPPKTKAQNGAKSAKA